MRCIACQMLHHGSLVILDTKRISYARGMVLGDMGGTPRPIVRLCPPEPVLVDTAVPGPLPRCGCAIEVSVRGSARCAPGHQPARRLTELAFAP
ncbi:hypothetical protein [Streptomyces hydrogenans]|uniref:hypothetical protein n=1 Tax=Streptomyces hydrogenans TaxID=1873719 RepID=UPI00343D167B